MRTLRAAAFGLLFVLGLVGCENRQRLNPFDPENPATGGTPSLLDARAANSRVTLHWDLEHVGEVRAARIFRRLLGTTDGELLTPDPLDPSAGTYIDCCVQNGIDYEYRLELELPSGARPVSAWDPATPGAVIPWVADSNGGGLLRMTPDGRDPATRVGIGRWTLDLAADTLEQTIWSVDYLGGALYQHALDGTEMLKVPLVGARAVDVDLDGESIWVGSFDQQRLERRLRDGSLEWASDGIGWIEDLLAVAPSGVWVCGQGGECRLYRNDVEVASYTNVEWPVALARSQQGRILVLDRAAGIVVRLGPFGIPEAHKEEGTLIDAVDVCRDDGWGAWVADPGRGGLVHLDDDLEEIGFVPREGALGVAWEERSERLWVVGTGGIDVRDASGRFLSGAEIGPRPVEVDFLYDGQER